MAVTQFVAPLIIFLLGCLLHQKLGNEEANSYPYMKGVHGPEFSFHLTKERRLSGHEALNKFYRTTKNGRNIHQFLCLLLLLGGDIERNPGEDYKQRCGICSDFITVDNLGINCEECDAWIHLNCCKFDNDTHDILSGSSLTWLCPGCGFSNFSKSFLNESIESLASANIFALLKEVSVNLQDIPESSHKCSKAKFQKHFEKPRAKKCKLTCLLVNCQSVRNKVAELETIIDRYEPDIIIGNESWLHSGISSNEISSDSYSMFRKDRYTDRHGGVFQAVRKDILVTECSEFDTDCEIVWTQCQIKNRKSKSIFFASYYRPNMSDMVSLDQLNNSLFKLSDKLNNHHVIVAGDFNAPNINWKDYAPEKASVYSDRLLEIVNEHGLNQMVKEPTRSQGDTHNILDMVFTNNENIVHNVKVLPGISDHDIVYFQVNLKCKKKSQVKRKIFIRKRADNELIRQKLRELANDFECLLKHGSLDAKWDAFQQGIQHIMNSCIPSKYTSSRYNLPWFNRALRRQTRVKQKLYNKAKKSGKEIDWAKFKTARKQLSKNLKSARDAYFTGYLTDTMQEDPKAFWSYIKRLRQDNPGVEDFRIDNELISDAGLKSEVLSKQFASVFTTENVDNIPTIESKSTPTIGNIVVTVKGVEKQLASLDPKKASGPDGIPPWFLKENASQIAPILTDIYQDSISSGTLPRKWKEANVCAVFKTGKKCDPGNYRPISLTCIAVKILEHIVHSHLMKHLEKYGVLIDN